MGCEGLVLCSTSLLTSQDGGVAQAEYERAAILDPSSPDPYRQLGLLHYQDKDFARAREAFQRYLAIRPDAPDARRIKEYLGELSR